MKTRQINLKIERDLVVDNMEQINGDAIKQLILSNKNDLIENTFCYELFENGFFIEKKILLLIEQVKYINRKNIMDNDIKNVLIWIVNGVDQCFLSHHDVDDLYFIQNYKTEYEIKWNTQWKKEICLQIAGGCK